MAPKQKQTHQKTNSPGSSAVSAPRRSPSLLLIHMVRAPTLPIDEALIRHIIARYEPPNPEPAIDCILVHPGSDVAGHQHLEVIGTTPNGIVCVAQGRYATTLTLWNPATRSTRPIPPSGVQPDPALHRTVKIGLAFDQAREDFSVIRITCHHRIRSSWFEEPDVAEVFSLRTGLWRPVHQPDTPFWVHGDKCAAVINGVPYWPCLVPCPDLGIMEMLLSFDANRAAFAVEPLGWASSGKDFLLGEIRQGRLGAVVWDEGSEDTEDQVIDVWMREEEGGWTSVFRDRRLPVVGEVVGFYGDMSGIVVEDGNEGNLIMLSLDSLETQDFRSFEGYLMQNFRVVNYRESLYPIPEMGKAII